MVSRHILTSSISASAHTSYSLKTPDLNVGLAYICSTWRSYLLHLKIAWFAPLSRCTALDSLNRGHFVPATWPNIRYHHLHQEIVWDTGRVWWERIFWFLLGGEEALTILQVWPTLIWCLGCSLTPLGKSNWCNCLVKSGSPTNTKVGWALPMGNLTILCQAATSLSAASWSFYFSCCTWTLW